MADKPCEQCGQWDWHPWHTGKNSATGDVEGPIDHAPVHTHEGATMPEPETPAPDPAPEPVPEPTPDV